MILLGLLLLLLGFLFHIGILWTIGIVVLIIGVVLFIIGATGHELAGRRYWF